MRSRRLVRALSAGLLAVALLAACGDDTTEDTAWDAVGPAQGTTPTKLRSQALAGDPLDEVEATAALLTAANVPGAFPDLSSGDEPDETAESDGKSGCETQDSFEDRLDRAGIATTRVEASYLYGDDARVLIVASLVASFANDTLAGAAYDEALADYSSCTHYEETDGTDTTVVDVESDTETADDEVDDQLNLVGEGTWSSEGFEDLPLGLGLSLARDGNNLTLTQLISLGVAEDKLLLAPYTQIAVDRLQAVAAGQTPEDVPGPTLELPQTFRLPFAPKQFAVDKYLGLAPAFGLPD